MSRSRAIRRVVAAPDGWVPLGELVGEHPTTIEFVQDGAIITLAKNSVVRTAGGLYYGRPSATRCRWRADPLFDQELGSNGATPRDSLDSRNRQRASLRRWREAGTAPMETIEEFLARGGSVQHCAPVYLVPIRC